MAFTPHAASQGLSKFIIALNGHADLHFPHLIHFFLSIDAPVSLKVTASTGHTVLHGCATHFLQLLVTSYDFSSHASQANDIILTSGGK